MHDVMVSGKSNETIRQPHSELGGIVTSFGRNLAIEAVAVGQKSELFYQAPWQKNTVFL
jgi:hypothetical protein